MKRVMVFAAHPDDEVIGCGGSIAKHVQRGDHVDIVYMTSGDAGSMVIPKAELARTRESEAVNGAGVLGVKPENLYFFRNPDGYLASRDDAWVDVTNIIRVRKPHVIYVHHEFDEHPDHQAVYRIVTQALFRAAGPWFQETKGEPWNVPTVLAYEVWTPTVHTDYFEDVTDVMDVKMAALRDHESQIADVPYEWRTKGIAMYRASKDGEYREAFQIIRVHDLGF